MIERLRVTRLEAVVGGTALVLAVAAFWLTVDADFLAHPGWLAVQKADVILGPVLVGLYWHRRRPRSRFGPLLIVAGFLHARTSCSRRPSRGRSRSGSRGRA